MENASKALIMAGSILIAIIIISLGIMIFNNMSNSVKNESNLDKQQISAFNSKITPYIGESISGSQVNTLIQLVRTINKKADNENNSTRKIKINNSYDLQRYETGEFYEVKGKYDANGLLTIITINKN